MSEQENKRAVQSIFAAFGRGDVPAILNALTEDVEWFLPGPAIVPQAGRRHGREEVRQFFQVMGEAAEFERFEPREFIAQGDKVIVIGFERGRARPTGRPFDNDWVMVFRFRDGQVASFRSYEDTAAVADAYRT